ncbi:hypothetical protein D3C87_1510300 [compost metagenome]
MFDEELLVVLGEVGAALARLQVLQELAALRVKRVLLIAVVIEKADGCIGQPELLLLRLVESQVDTIGLPLELCERGRRFLISRRRSGESVEGLARSLSNLRRVGLDALVKLLGIERLAVLAKLLEQRRALDEELGEGLLPGLALRSEAFSVGKERAVARQARARHGEAHSVANGKPTSGHGLDDLGTELTELDKRKFGGS